MSPTKIPVLAIVYIEDFNTAKTEAYIQLKLKKIEKVGRPPPTSTGTVYLNNVMSVELQCKSLSHDAANHGSEDS